MVKFDVMPNEVAENVISEDTVCQKKEEEYILQ